MRDRRQQRRAQPLGLVAHVRLLQIRHQLGAQRGLGDIVHHCLGQLALLRRQPGRLAREAHAGHADRPVVAVQQRQEPPARAGQRIGETSAGLAMPVRPVGRGQIGIARRGAATGAGVLPDAQPRRRIHRLFQRLAAGLGDLLVARCTGQLPAQGLARMCVPVGRAQRHHLHAQARGQSPGHQGCGQEQEDRDHALARADREGEARRDEEEVVGQETQRGGDHRCTGAAARGDHHHRHDEHHREVVQPDPALGDQRHQAGNRRSAERQQRILAGTAAGHRQPGPACPRARLWRTDDGDLEMRTAPDQLLGQRAVEHARQRPLARAAQHQRGDTVVCGMVKQCIGDAGAMQQLRFTAEATGEGEGGIDLATGLLVVRAPLHRHHRPRRIAPLGDAPADPHQVLALAAAIDRHQHAAAQRQVAFAARSTGLAQAAVHAVGCFLHRQFAQCGQVGRREKRLQRLRGLLRHIDLALLQPLDQLARRQVDQHDVVQAVEYRIGHGLADPHPGDAHDHVIEAFQMLDVDRGPYIDAGIEQLHHVLPAPLVPAAGHIAVGQLVHQHQSGATCQHRIQVHFIQRVLLILTLQQRHLRQARQQRRGLGAAVGFHQPDHHVHAAAQLLVRAGEHAEGLAHAGGRTQEHGEFAASFALQALDQGIGLARTGVAHGRGLCAREGTQRIKASRTAGQCPAARREQRSRSSRSPAAGRTRPIAGPGYWPAPTR
ncbi:hypothetical protein D3C71_1044480 [compost metagenome]